MMGHWFGNFGWFGMIVNLALSIGVIVGIVYLVIWIIKGINTNDHRSVENEAPSSIEITKVRYAKGEITREEYLNLLTDLSTES